MKNDNHSVVYFVNEEYGVVIRDNGTTGEVAMWVGTKGGFTRRIDDETAEFLRHTDRFGGKWCAAHATCSRLTAEKAAAAMTANLPSSDGMARATAAKRAAMRSEMREKGAERMLAEIADR